MITKQTQKKIKDTVQEYIELFPQEYSQLVYVIEEQRKNMKNDMAEIKSTHALKRGLYTVSETLTNMLIKKLEGSELNEMSEKDSARWFAKEFPQFSLTKV